MRILAIDPGTEISGAVQYENGAVLSSEIEPNLGILYIVENFVCSIGEHKMLAVEMVASYGMPVGREVFETCVWIGRFVERFNWLRSTNDTHRFVYRKDVKLHLCGSPRAKDAHIRQALIDKLGAPGTKKAPGATYGVKSHAWAALAVAVTAAET